MSIACVRPDLTAQTAYTALPDLDAGFEGQVTVINTCADATAYVYVSFNGTTDQEVELRPASPSTAIAFTAKRRKVWVRRAAGGGFVGALTCQIIMEGT